jgi:PhoPQ-activated pathogenicity-related protein
VAVLQQVPNQPLKGGLKEDALIAYTFDQYLKTGDPDYPLLLPMVKSAVAAMDAVTRWSKQQLGQSIETFFVTGASKRGWTTWLTAAVDDRVTGIAPMVIDVLNLKLQMERQLKTYGQYSPMIGDYVEYNILKRLDTERGKELLTMVDPYSYRAKITIPKLIILGTNDPYWTVDAANLYVPDLAGPTYLHYSPNAGHGLSADSGKALSTIMSMASFIRMTFSKKEMPELHWRHETPDTLIVEWEDKDAQAVLWSAQSPVRDFRQADWKPRPLQGQGKAVVRMTQPEQGWQAWFVELVFGGEYPIRLTTAITVLPDTFQYDH